MDQLKTQLAVVMKYGFWISSTLVLLGSLYFWWSTTSTLATESAQQTSKINQAISTVSSIEAELDTTPNEHSHEEMRELIKQRQDLVLESWEMLYDKQRDLLTWPVDELTDEFINEFAPMIPIETHIDFPTPVEQEKETTLLNQYSRYIKNILPSIAEIAGAEWTAEFEGAASMGMMGGMEMMDMGMGGGGRTNMVDVDITGVEKGPLVTWSAGSQGSVLEDLFPWRGSQPTTLEVYYSQENIWILKQLLQIVSDVNGAAKQPYQAKIHEIKSIKIGKSVKFGAGNISKPGARVSSMGMDMEMEMGMDMGMDMEMEMGMAAGGTSAVLTDPADNRYVDPSFEPIAATALRSALTSESPNDASIAVAKRVPVMLSLNMDQRAVHELLATCGSANLMVEVDHVRVLPKTKGSALGGGMGGMEEEMGGGMEMDMGMGGMGMGGMGMGGMGMGGMGGGMMGKTEDEFPLDMSIEVYGIIYIYNPPDEAKLGLEKVTEDTVIAGTGETIGGATVAPTATTPAAPTQTNDELPTPQADPAPPVADPAAPVADPTTAPPADATAPAVGAPADATALAPAPADAAAPATPDGTAPVPASP